MLNFIELSLQRVNVRLTTDTEVTYCEMLVNNHWSIHTCSDVMLTKAI